MAAAKFKKPRVPLKWHGGKTYLAADFNAMFPPHLHYVEPYCGGCAVLLSHHGEGRSELVNDINGELVNWWKVLRSAAFPEFVRRCEATPLARSTWEDAVEMQEMGEMAYNEVGRAWSFFVACRQSLAGRGKSFTPPTRTRLRRGMNGNVSEWLGAVEMLPEIHARLKRVFVENMHAPDLIRREDTPGTLFYCDPPYLHETRATTGEYEHEMTGEQHEEMLSALSGVDGKFALSGYRSKMYDLFAGIHGWKRRDFSLPNNAAGGEEKRRMTECLWYNW